MNGLRGQGQNGRSVGFMGKEQWSFGSRPRRMHDINAGAPGIYLFFDLPVASSHLARCYESDAADYRQKRNLTPMTSSAWSEVRSEQLRNGTERVLLRVACRG